MTAVSDHNAASVRDRFIPVHKSDIIDALVALRESAGDGECGKFRQLCQMLAAVYHYEYFTMLERLREDYYYFAPGSKPHAGIDPKMMGEAYTDLVRSLEQVLKDANFVELPHETIGEAHRKRPLQRVEIVVPLDDFREVRFFRRGHHMEQIEISEWFGLRRRKVETEVYDDVVLLAATKPQEEIASQRELRDLQRHNIEPGSVLLKCFRNISSGDLKMLFPNARVIMSNLDKLVLGLPAIAGGIPIVLNLYATITVLFLVVGFYLGFGTAVADRDMKTALAALSGLVALGAFVMRQWLKYQRRSLKYQIELTESIYFRNINNNAGIFDYVIGAAEDQECKEAFIAYHFLQTAPTPPTADELYRRVESWLLKSFGIDLDFEGKEALAKLEGIGLVKRDGDRLVVSPLDQALIRLRSAWGDLLSDGAAPATP